MNNKNTEVDSKSQLRRNIFMSLTPVLALAVILSFSHGCTDSGAPFSPNPADTIPDTTIDTTTSGITYENFVGPLLVSSCDGIGCHNSVPGTSSFGVTSYSAVLAGGFNGPGIVAGDTANSLVYQKLLSLPPFGGRMPQGGPFLTQEKLDSIAVWILNGAPEN